MSFFGAVAGAAVGAAAAEVVLHQLHKQNGSAPAGAVQCGHQRDGAGALWGAVAHTEWGEIPGKAKGGECWFPYGGRENTTNNFSYIVVPSGWHLEKNQGYPPAYSLRVGFQNDGAGHLWLAVAHTEWGEIPGKAKGNECWFPYGNKEMVTTVFSWVVANPPPQPQVVYAQQPQPVSYVPQQPATVIVQQQPVAPATVIIEEREEFGRHAGRHHHHHHHERW